MKYIHEEIIKEYLSGTPIQVQSHVYNDVWYDISPYSNEYFPLFNPERNYRVKPQKKLFFMHVQGLINKKQELTINDEVYVFEYPTYEPSGPYIMFKVEDEEIKETKYYQTYQPENHNEQ